MKHSIILFLALAFGYSQGMNDDIQLAQVRVSGNAITSENTIVFTAGLREGQTITPADFPRAIKRLWQLGLFQDIQIQYDEETDEGLSLTIIVKENFILGEVMQWLPRGLKLFRTSVQKKSCIQSFILLETL